MRNSNAFLPRGIADVVAMASVLWLAACASTPVTAPVPTAARDGANRTSAGLAPVVVARSERFAEGTRHFINEASPQWVLTLERAGSVETAYWSEREEVDRRRHEVKLRAAPMVAIAPVAVVPTPATGSRPVAPAVESLAVHFGFDQSTVSSAERSRIKAFVERLLPPGATAAASAHAWRVVGHTDSIGSDLYNDLLSARRAEAVRRELQRLNVPAERIRVVGRGAAEPAASNATENGRARNRRADIAPGDPRER